MGSLTRRKHPDRAPVTGIASPVKPVQSSEFSSGSLGRGGNPLKTFSVPDPPLQQSTVPSTTPKHIGKLAFLGKPIISRVDLSTLYLDEITFRFRIAWHLSGLASS